MMVLFDPIAGGLSVHDEAGLVCFERPAESLGVFYYLDTGVLAIAMAGDTLEVKFEPVSDEDGPPELRRHRPWTWRLAIAPPKPESG